MRCSEYVFFKSVAERSSGTFKNANGEEIKYDKSYVVLFDEPQGKSAVERKVKFDGKNVDLYNKFSSLELYDRINLVFDVSFVSSGVKVMIVDFNALSEED